MGNETAIFAAGCFWGVQDEFDQLPGVIATEVGYTGGRTDNPTYEQICRKGTGHAEAVKVDFDSRIVAFEELLAEFFNLHDPTQLNRQGPDVGDQYRSAIFPQSPEQEMAAKAAIAALDESGKHNAPIATTVEPAAPWWRAEEYHQMYFQKGGRGGCRIG